MSKANTGLYLLRGIEMKGKLLLGVLMTVCVLGKTAMAQDVYSSQFQTIQSVETVEITTDANGNEVEKVVAVQKMPDQLLAQMDKAYKVYNKSQKVDKVIMVADKLIAFGERIYKVLEKGKPVLDVDSRPVSVLPLDEKGKAIEAFAMTNWSSPKARKFQFRIKNYLGMTPIVFDFMVIFVYGGQHEGKGRYLTGTQIKPIHIHVSWGFKLDAVFKVQSIVNQGTVDNQIAGAVLELDYKMSTVFQTREMSSTYFVNGLGEVVAY